MASFKNVVLVQTDLHPIYDEYPTRTLRKRQAEPPLGLCYMAAFLEREGCEISIIDNYLEGLDDDSLAREILARKADIVGFSVTSVSVFQVEPVARMIKSASPGTKIVCGGIHATVMPDDVLAIAEVDFVVIGEGEITFSELVRFLRERGTGPCTVPGVMSRDEHGVKMYAGDRPLIEDLDTLPLPARRYLDLSRYTAAGIVIHAQGAQYLSSSRGCPYGCAFCASSPWWGRRFRYRSARNLADEVELLVMDFGAKGLVFREDNFTVNERRLMAFCDEMKKRGLDQVPWECETRVDAVNREQLEIMYQAGFRGAWVGVESGSQRILDQVGKGITLEQIRTFFRNTRSVGIDIGAVFMLGFPDETREEVQMSIELGKELEPQWALYTIFVGYPDSPLYRYVVEHGMTRRRWGTVVEVVPRHFTPEEALELERYANFEVPYALAEARAARSSMPRLATAYTRTKRRVRMLIGDRLWEMLERARKRILASIEMRSGSR